MAVRLFLASGEQRVVEGNEARIPHQFFFEVTNWNPTLNRTENVITMRADEVGWRTLRAMES